MKHFWILCGCPASGKSTYFKSKCVKDNVAVVSRDEIRFSLLNDEDDYFAKEDEVLATFYKRINENLANPDINLVVADATHLNEKSRAELFRNVTIPKDVSVGALCFEVPLNVCLERNEQREGRAKVPRGVIKRMYYSYTRPTEEEGFDKIMVIKE